MPSADSFGAARREAPERHHRPAEEPPVEEAEAEYGAAVVLTENEVERAFLEQARAQAASR